jgi:micrococcal nuclease
VTRRPLSGVPLAFAVVAMAAAGCADGDAPSTSPAPVAGGPGETARVVRVVDGDTLIARLDGDEVRVRLLGVDAPESVTPDRPVECFGPQAAAEARRLLPRGARVGLATDPSQGRDDRFGRLLAEVTPEGAALTVNERLVAGGFAEVFRGDGRGRLQPRLRAAEREARDAGRGLWGACR